MMPYVLVLQFPASDIARYDQIIQVEEALIKYLRGFVDIDGHDAGTGEMNIFILTNEPTAMFDKAKIIVKAANLLSDLSAAYRSVDGAAYIRLWPRGSHQPFVVA